MIYLFDDFELDAEKVELRRDETVVALEPQVFSLLLLLVESRDRMVSKDEIIEKIWHGRIVSESAITSRIKSARRALGDDGKLQRFIRTIRKSGLRFVLDGVHVRAAPAPASFVIEAGQQALATNAPVTKPSIAVLPFRLVGIAGPYAMVADALPHELIVALSRFRWLFVIARGSSFRFRAVDADTRRVGEALNVRYCLSGQVEITGGTTIIVTVELSDTQDGGVVWGERFATEIGGVFEVHSQVVASIASALEIQIPLNEARVARLKPTANLDAWSAYHLGLQHMFRFNKDDNAKATELFEQAIADDPNFARANAGLSFTHFQNAFLRYGDPAAEAVQARRFAERSVELDPMDPFANFTMGRVFWLEQDLDGSVGWLERATALSPSYAQGVYARAWTDTVSGRGADGQVNADLAMSLSPIDPLRYAMLATRALSHLVRGNGPEAADWADKAARSPGAHVLIGMIAVISHSLNGDDGKAAVWAANVRSRNPAITQHEFFRCFPFGNDPIRQSISKALSKHDL